MKRFLKFFTDILSAMPLLMLGNALCLWHTVQDVKIKLIILFLLIIYYLGCLFLPERKQAQSRKLAVLSHGIRLIRQGCICSVVQIPVSGNQISTLLMDNMMIQPAPDWLNLSLLIGNLLIFLLMLAG